MKTLTEEELNQKINKFLRDRFAAHPKLAAKQSMISTPRTDIVSRVKQFSKKFTHVPAV